MYLRTRTWAVISLVCFLAAFYFWQLGEKRAAREQEARRAAKTNAVVPLLSMQTNLVSQTQARSVGFVETNGPIPYRVSNTKLPMEELVRSDAAVLLRNALIDVTSGVSLPIPEHLRVQGETKSYVVQARGATTDDFRNQLKAAGAEIVSYVPNNAYLVRVSSDGAQALRTLPLVQAVIAWEPYFKLVNSQLLALAVEQKPLPNGNPLVVVAFPGEEEASAEALRQLGVTVMRGETSPFGTQLVVHSPPEKLVDIVQVDTVQAVEPAYRRGKANDLARTRVRITTNTTTADNYLGLTGQGIRVGVNDTGVDQFHPDLTGRVFPLQTGAGTDVDGHGTHVAGTIASSGVSKPQGPVPGSTNTASFRGMAPSATIWVQPIDILTGPLRPDTELQAITATNEAFISNNSWGYLGAYDYTFAAASWDAAVRDSIPSQPGPQAVTYVFSAGNDGFGADDGSGGFENSIAAPATGKNVITVGAIEQFRNITNELVINGETNMPFFAATDSDDDVAGFSSRGNVGPGVEGGSGRFKPDVVAPGVFVVSSRASGWTSNLNITANAAFLTEEVVPVGETNYYFFFGNPNAIEARIRVTPNGRSPVPFPTNTLYIRRGNLPPPSDIVVTSNSINFNLPVPDDTYYIGVGNNFNQDVYFDIQVVVVSRRPFTPADQELINLNSDLEPNLRYESGTSMATPVVSGMLALIREKLLRSGVNPSPDLMKALLINGARSIGQYDLKVDKVRNHQGWGLVNVTNSVPFHSPDNRTTEWPVTFFQGGPGLVTGESISYTASLSTNAPDLRITLVWTDPPGNPSVSTKLVNDLDLIVTNLASGEVYVGNVISGDFSTPVAGSNVVSAVDRVNNVENVLIPNPRGGTNFSITVKARRVNVNAVTAHNPTGVAQDYALVISCGNLAAPNTIGLVVSSTGSDPTPKVTALTNSVATFRSTAGGNPSFWTRPNSNGIPSQWQFFVFNNNPTNGGTNVAFFTFLTPNLSRPRASEEADIDLYVSTDPGLTNLIPAVIGDTNLTRTSRRRGGTEAVVFPGDNPVDQTYYIGVKSEDQQAAQFGLFGFAGNTPFSEEDSNGVVTVYGLALPVDIPDGSSEEASGVMVFAYCLQEIEIQNVVVTNILTHDNGGDLFGRLEHDGAKAILNNHRGFEGTVEFIYDDSGSGQIVNSTRSDGPDTLRNFWGMQGQGAWQLLMVDDALSATGRVEALTLRLEPPQDTNSDGFATALILPEGWFYTFVDVPPDATRLRIEVAPDTGPIEVYVGRNFVPDDVFYDHTAVFAPPGGTLDITPSDNPPLSGGLYFIGFHNPNSVAVRITYRIRVERNLTGSLTNIYNPVGVLPLLDDAVTTSLLSVTTAREIVDVRVGVRIDHERASDLVLTLVSPAGTRVVLAENRGGDSQAGYGAGGARPYLHTIFTDNTNLTTTPIKFGSPPFTNSPGLTNMQTTLVPGAAVLSSGFEDLSWGCGALIGGDDVDGWFVGGGNVDLLCSGVNQSAHSGDRWLDLNGTFPGFIYTNLPTNPNSEYLITFAYARNPQVATAMAEIQINSASNSSVVHSLPNPTTNLNWQVGSARFRSGPGPRTLIGFQSRTPGAFGLYLDSIQIVPVTVRTNERNYFLPEEPLREVRGENAYGTWRLEIWDNRAGNPLQGAALRDWQLDFDFASPNPPTTTMTNGQCVTGTLEGTAVRYFRVNVPVNATRATNTFFSTNPTNSLNMSADSGTLPTGSSPPDDYLPVIGPNGRLEIDLADTPPLRPGLFYYVALRNIDPRQTNTFTFCVNFDASPTNNLSNVVPLTNNTCLAHSIEGTNLVSYYSFDASSNAVGLFFDLRNPSGNVDMFVRRGLPLPIRGNSIESRNPGTADEHIAVGTGQIPGRWYIGILNNETNRVNYTLCVSEFTNYFRLTNDVCSSNTLAGFGQTHHFRFTITPGAELAEFTVDASGDVDLYLRRTPPVSEFVYDYASARSFASNETIVLDRNSQPVPLLPGDWHAAVVNREVGVVNYCMKFSQVDPGSIRLYITNGFEQNPRYMDLAWNAPEYLRFHLEYSDSLAPADWQPFLDGNSVPIVFAPVGGAGTSFYFRDNSLFSPTTGLITMRFYRLRVLP